jgi:hypothetical protein
MPKIFVEVIVWSLAAVRWFRPVTNNLVLAALVGAQALGYAQVLSFNDDAQKVCSLANATDEAERDMAIHRQSAPLQRALVAEPGLWKFIIDPATSYQDRMAAALQGVTLLTAKDLPTLWKAEAELEVLPKGVYPSPCEFIWPHAESRGGDWFNGKFLPSSGGLPKQPQSVTVLGVHMDLPPQPVDYPLDEDARSKAPWLWQVARAIAIMEQGEREIFAQPGRYPEMAEVALSWQPANFYERQIRELNMVQVVEGLRNAYFIEAMVRLCLQGGGGLPQLVVSAVPTLHLKALAHAAQIVVLQQTHDEHIALGAAAAVAEMSRRIVSLPVDAQARPTGTSILAIARWAVDPDLDPSIRYLFATELCDATVEPDCKRWLDLDQASKKGKRLFRFEAWLTAERPRLIENAAKERSALVKLAAEIHQSIGTLQ